MTAELSPADSRGVSRNKVPDAVPWANTLWVARHGQPDATVFPEKVFLLLSSGHKPVKWFRADILPNEVDDDMQS